MGPAGCSRYCYSWVCVSHCSHAHRIGDRRVLPLWWWPSTPRTESPALHFLLLRVSALSLLSSPWIGGAVWEDWVAVLHSATQSRSTWGAQWSARGHLLNIYSGAGIILRDVRCLSCPTLYLRQPGHCEFWTCSISNRLNVPWQRYKCPSDGVLRQHCGPMGPSPCTALFSKVSRHSNDQKNKSSIWAGIWPSPALPGGLDPGTLAPTDSALGGPRQFQEADWGNCLNIGFACTKKIFRLRLKSFWLPGILSSLSFRFWSASLWCPLRLSLVSRSVRLCPEAWPLSPARPRCAHLAWSLSSDRWG